MQDGMEPAAVRCVADVATPQALRYLGQLCAHFGHRLPVTREGDAGRIDFGASVCLLRADADVLRLELWAADEAGMARGQDVVARHLIRFAFREELQVAWRAAS